MNADDPRLRVPNAKEDKAARGRVSLVLLVAAVLAGVVSRQTTVGGIPGPILALGVLTGAFLAGWRAGIFARAHAMLRLPTLRVQGLEATKRLNDGDLSGARAGFEALIETARPLGAFHAVHVLMLGVVEFFEGDTKKGLALATRAIESGWFTMRQSRDVLSAAETWRVFMLLDAGELRTARAIVEAAPQGSLPSGEVALLAYEKKWPEVLERVKALLADAQFPEQGKPTLNLIAAHAAKASGVDASAYQRNAELNALAKKNPALRPFAA
ncbi:MAG: hypothetical protein QM817_14910 [Archangium sp.]